MRSYSAIALLAGCVMMATGFIVGEMEFSAKNPVWKCVWRFIGNSLLRISYIVTLASIPFLMVTTIMA